ncbi:protein-glutamate O-methyltransferase CheR [Treponema berlinense]|uniref:CheR family methyltransferase n=1 Tax=Treponema berlinense TaxID=225004 RepID=UPI0026E98B77|nr:CheR family methyltransferase [Treponema berlinense]
MAKIGFFSPAELTDSQFHRISEFIQKNVGIKMPEEKRLMVQSRLTGRLKSLKMSNFDDYLNFAFSGTLEGSEEIALMINAITTNLTNFFRENVHFEYLTDTVLPELAQKNIKKVELWSAGCSTGQEPYTLSIVMQEFMKKNPGKIDDYSVYATDISSRVLDKAIDAVYPMSEVESLSLELKKRYFLKSKDTVNPSVRLKPEIRQKVSFDRLNFMAPSYPRTTEKNVIFCRNVLIYFDKPTQESVVRKLLEHLMPGGYLFLGHSETIFGMDLPLKTVGPTIFKKI